VGVKNRCLVFSKNVNSYSDSGTPKIDVFEDFELLAKIVG
jgi:hypothetical protein